jgi:hypothetical protein
MVKKPIFLHIRKKVRFFLVLNTFFIIPNITFAESKIYWNAQTDVFSIQSMSTIREVLDCIGSVVILGGLTFVNFSLCIHLC